MTDLVLGVLLVLAASTGGPVALMPLAALVAAIALVRLNARGGRRRVSRSQYGPEKGRRMVTLAVGILLALTAFATVPVTLAGLAEVAPSPPVAAASAVLAAACWLRFAFDRGDPVGATSLSPRRAAFAGLAATGGLSFGALAMDPVIVQMADFAAAMVVALLAAAAGTRLATVSVLELIDAPLPADAEMALRLKLKECGLVEEHLADIRHRRASGRLILDVALPPAPGLPARALAARAADLRARLLATLPADVEVKVGLKL